MTDLNFNEPELLEYSYRETESARREGEPPDALPDRQGVFCQKNVFYMSVDQVPKETSCRLHVADDVEGPEEGQKVRRLWWFLSRDEPFVRQRLGLSALDKNMASNFRAF